MKQKRLEYIDIAKGIMICLLVYHHYPSSVQDIPIYHYSEIKSWQEWFLVFFMPAFFFITGFCSNFNKPFKEFLISNLKVLILPAILFIAINRIIYSLFFCDTQEEIINQLLHGATLWFLWSLFFAKIIHWYLKKYSMCVCMSIYLLLTLIGVACSFHKVPNIFFFQNTFALSLFLYIGDILKNMLKNKKRGGRILVTCSILFIVMMASLIYFHLPRPIVTGVIVLGSYKELPLYWILASLGCGFILAVSYMLKNCIFFRIFQSIGRRTLVIYSIHGIYYTFFLNYAASIGLFGYHTLLFDSIVCLVICILTILLGYITALIIEKIPILKYLIGKW